MGRKRNVDDELAKAAQKKARRVLAEMRKTVNLASLPYLDALHKAEKYLSDMKNTLPSKTVSLQAEPNHREVIRQELRLALQEEYEKTQIQGVRFLHYKNNQWHAGKQTIDFPDPNADYCKLLLVMYQLSIYDQEVRYEKLNTLLQQQGLHQLTDKLDMAKRINNLRTNLYRKRQRQSVPLPKIAPDGEKIIRVIPGRGLVFHNPFM